MRQRPSFCGWFLVEIHVFLLFCVVMLQVETSWVFGEESRLGWSRSCVYRHPFDYVSLQSLSVLSNVAAFFSFLSTMFVFFFFRFCCNVFLSCCCLWFCCVFPHFFTRFGLTESIPLDAFGGHSLFFPPRGAGPRRTAPLGTSRDKQDRSCFHLQPPPRGPVLSSWPGPPRALGGKSGERQGGRGVCTEDELFPLPYLQRPPDPLPGRRNVQ